MLGLVTDNTAFVVALVAVAVGVLVPVRVGLPAHNLLEGRHAS